jgi:RHS repeat-associated protein
MELAGEQIMAIPDYTQPMQGALMRYELNDHLGNVTAVVTGRLLPGNNAGSLYQAELISAQGYEPFGSLLPGRNYSSDAYRFGFQGAEKDDEVHGATGTSYAFEYRMHDPRIGRFLSIDPLAQDFAWNSPYAFSENRVLDGIDFEGLEHLNNKYLIDRSTGGKTQLTVMDEYKQPGPGKHGWGIDARFYMKDEAGVIHEVPELRVFMPSDPPLFHFGGGPLYVNGWEVPNSAPRAMEGEHGFHNGGKQVMMGTVGLILSGGSMVAAGSVSFTGAAGLALTADELTAGGKNGSVMEQLIGKTPTKYIKLANLVGSFSTGLTSLIKNTANGKTDDFFMDFMNVLNDEFDLMMEVAPPLNGDGANP